MTPSRACKNLGSSLQAIKIYIAANYDVDAEKITPYIEKYLKASVPFGSIQLIGI